MEMFSQHCTIVFPQKLLCLPLVTQSMYYRLRCPIVRNVKFINCYDSITFQAEMRLSPRLNQHASGVILGVSQIINGLDDLVGNIIVKPIQLLE